LKSKDIESSKVIDFQTKRLIKIQDSIAALKGKLASNNRDYEDKVKQMKAQKDALQTQFQEMKRKMALFRGEERKKLTSLTVLSASVLDILKDKVAQAERILKLVEFSAPLETANDHQWNKFEVELDEGSKAMVNPRIFSAQLLLTTKPHSFSCKKRTNTSKRFWMAPSLRRRNESPWSCFINDITRYFWINSTWKNGKKC
jgi:hypothetical protein